ncbi:MAG: LPS export ABC transporter permease LptG, partial [Nitrospirae bacterium]
AYFLLNVPVVAFRLFPLVAMLSTILALAALSRDSEIVAMRAVGVSLYRVVWPLLQAGLALSVVLLLLGELAIPRMHQEADLIKQTRIRHREANTELRTRDIWLRGAGGRIYYARRFDPEARALLHVTWFDFDPGFRITGRTDVERMVWQGDRWRLEGVVERRFRADGGVETHRAAVELRSLPEGLSAFRRVKKRPADMNWVELRRYIRRLAAEGGDVVKLRADLHAKLAQPFSAAVLTLLAIPFAIQRPRSGGTGKALALGLALGLAYWFLLQVGLSLGHGGKLPPLLAAWLGNLVFGAVGLYRLIHLPQ